MDTSRNTGGWARRTAACVLASVVLGAAAAPSAVAAGKSGAASLDGVWKITNVTTTGANPSTVANPQPGLFIFAHGHYSFVAVMGDKPRSAAPSAKDPARPTDAEKLAKYEEWSSIVAQSGTYEVKGATLIRQPLVAKNVVAMGPEGRAEQEFKLSGDSLVLTSKSAAGQPVREQRMTLARVR
jgi:hypothetical protein